MIKYFYILCFLFIFSVSYLGIKKNYEIKQPIQEQTDSNKDELVEYNGVICNIFFHPLIIYPEYAFDYDKNHELYYDWFVTLNEAVSIINDLYENGYILISISDLVECKSDIESGKYKITKKKLFLPKGKKPLILSIDDLNYYNLTIHDGTACKLIIADDGKLSEVIIKGKEKEQSRGKSFVTMIDLFVENNPDFSYNGAKGLIALTGYEGVFGYDTHKDVSLKEDAVAVAKTLKKSGWEFASHTYGHRNIELTEVSKLKIDTEKWNKEVASIVGPTKHIVYPYGADPSEKSKQFKYYLNHGYTFFWGVGKDFEFRVEDNYVFLNRTGIDGKCLRGLYGNMADFFDSKKAIDKLRISNKKTKPTKTL